MRLARLTERKQFLAAADQGRRFRSSAFTVQVLDAPSREGGDGTAGEGLRLGLTASRKVGNAVKRNRIRRRLRVAAQQALAAQADRTCDVVVVARPETLTMAFATLVSELSIAIERARPQGQGRKPRSAKPAPGKTAAARAGDRSGDAHPTS
ncbi:ribonuclease P protein component [Bosea sp. (in: a-proteobacteria)]|jgi:ribonuclease P protein component|uniref:ribonuclease P protein component n=1 Tax=Bosea sp. (in: a-proteobacteria) TaxID=1871050 RepID=UPI00273480EE|nr:ribonuclease P protein component [Bosea sp. (in: a-proteobacteria)]MDP3409468.1 ribonuclease P protein component [Bosea sp. (in: a-proteobacteria)]